MTAKTAIKHDDPYQTQEWCDYVVASMRAGAALTWGPKTAYVLQQASGETEIIRWYVGQALRKAGTIVADRTDWAKPQVLRLAKTKRG